jgi:small conductance mechanosensitive channel
VAALENPLTTLEQVKNTLIDLAIRFGPRLLTALLILGFGILVTRWVGKWLMHALARIELEPPVRSLLIRVGRMLVFVLFFILALQNLGVELLPLIAGLGIAGAGIALAMQGVLGNVAAGLTIIFTKPFRVGEYISIAGEEGLVENISIFSTTLSHVDLSRVVIPNRKIAGEILHNYGAIRQLDVSVGISYDSDLTTALAVIENLLHANARVLKDPAPFIQAVRLAEWSVTIAVKPWVTVADYMPAIGEINRAIIDAFRSRGIVIPVPQREVRLLQNAPSGLGLGA